MQSSNYRPVLLPEILLDEEKRCFKALPPIQPSSRLDFTLQSLSSAEEKFPT